MQGKAQPWGHVVPVADGYRGEYKGQSVDTGTAYGERVGESLENAAEPIAAFMSESLLGCGGQVIPPDGYFKSAYDYVRGTGALCIADEVQVSFGRVGRHFWALELQDVVPDVVVMGKPIGNGHPMAAVVTTRAIADSFANGMEYFATFGGNPVSCAIGMAVLDVIEDEQLQAHALLAGENSLAALEKLEEKHSIIGDVRGVGLFIGVELVHDRVTLKPAHEQAVQIVSRLRGRGILMSTDGPLNNVLKIKPPMVLTRDDIDMVLRCLDEELTAL